MATAATPAETAAILAALELILRPEYDTEFLDEMNEAAAVDATTENVEILDRDTLKLLAGLAGPLIARLTPELAAPYIAQRDNTIQL